jgi:hypothetical protein
MYWPDWLHHAEVLHDLVATTPSRTNTLFWTADAPRTLQNATAVQLTYAELDRQLQALKNAPILFVGNLFTLLDTAPESVMQRMQSATETSCEFFVLDPKWPQT